MKFKLTDEVLAAIARSVQLGMLTGTDVVDHLRILELEAEGELLKLSQECKERVERNVQDLLDQAKRLSETAAAADKDNN